MAMAMREAAGTLIADWRERGRNLGFGAGITQGYATLGQIGLGRVDPLQRPVKGTVYNASLVNCYIDADTTNGNMPVSGAFQRVGQPLASYLCLL